MLQTSLSQQKNKDGLYSFCIANIIIQPERLAQTTFYRCIRENELLTTDNEDPKKRLAYSMKYANQVWQADTMYGPLVDPGLERGPLKQTQVVAFVDEASCGR